MTALYLDPKTDLFYKIEGIFKKDWPDEDELPDNVNEDVFKEMTDMIEALRPSCFNHHSSWTELRKMAIFHLEEAGYRYDVTRNKFRNMEKKFRSAKAQEIRSTREKAVPEPVSRPAVMTDEASAAAVLAAMRKGSIADLQRPALLDMPQPEVSDLMVPNPSELNCMVQQSSLGTLNDYDTGQPEQLKPKSQSAQQPQPNSAISTHKDLALGKDTESDDALSIDLTGTMRSNGVRINEHMSGVKSESDSTSQCEGEESQASTSAESKPTVNAPLQSLVSPAIQSTPVAAAPGELQAAGVCCSNCRKSLATEKCATEGWGRQLCSDCHRRYMDEHSVSNPQCSCFMCLLPQTGEQVSPEQKPNRSAAGIAIAPDLGLLAEASQINTPVPDTVPPEFTRLKLKMGGETLSVIEGPILVSPPGNKGMYDCTFCGKAFSTMAQRRRHQEWVCPKKIQSGPCKYSCEQCGNSFPVQSSLKKHIARAHGWANMPVEQVLACVKLPEGLTVKPCHVAVQRLTQKTLNQYNVTLKVKKKRVNKPKVNAPKPVRQPSTESNTSETSVKRNELSQCHLDKCVFIDLNAPLPEDVKADCVCKFCGKVLKKRRIKVAHERKWCRKNPAAARPRMGPSGTIAPLMNKSLADRQKIKLKEDAILKLNNKEKTIREILQKTGAEGEMPPMPSPAVATPATLINSVAATAPNATLQDMSMPDVSPIQGLPQQEVPAQAVTAQKGGVVPGLQLQSQQAAVHRMKARNALPGTEDLKKEEFDGEGMLIMDLEAEKTQATTPAAAAAAAAVATPTTTAQGFYVEQRPGTSVNVPPPVLPTPQQPQTQVLVTQQPAMAIPVPVSTSTAVPAPPLTTVSAPSHVIAPVPDVPHVVTTQEGFIQDQKPIQPMEDVNGDISMPGGEGILGMQGWTFESEEDRRMFEALLADPESTEAHQHFAAKQPAQQQPQQGQAGQQAAEKKKKKPARSRSQSKKKPPPEEGKEESATEAEKPSEPVLTLETVKPGCICEFCGKLFKQRRIKVTHQKRYCQKNPRPREKYQCETCQKRVYGKIAMENHHKLKHNQTAYICENCETVFLSFNLLDEHCRNEHKLIPYSCEYCDEKVFGPRTFERHRYAHARQENDCDVCQTKIVGLRAMEDHHRSKHCDLPFICEFCGDTLYWLKIMENHRLAHMNGDIEADNSASESVVDDLDNSMDLDGEYVEGQEKVAGGPNTAETETNTQAATGMPYSHTVSSAYTASSEPKPTNAQNEPPPYETTAIPPGRALPVRPPTSTAVVFSGAGHVTQPTPASRTPPRTPPRCKPKNKPQSPISVTKIPPPPPYDTLHMKLRDTSANQQRASDDQTPIRKLITFKDTVLYRTIENKCEKCQRVFDYKLNCQKHQEKDCNTLAEITTKRIWQCRFCEKSFSFAASCYKHMKEECDQYNKEADNALLKFPCSQCNKVFMAALSLRGHILSKHAHVPDSPEESGASSQSRRRSSSKDAKKKVKVEPPPVATTPTTQVTVAPPVTTQPAPVSGIVTTYLIFVTSMIGSGCLFNIHRS